MRGSPFGAALPDFLRTYILDIPVKAAALRAEITPEMLEAGLDVYYRFIDDYDDSKEFLSHVFSTMRAVQLLQRKKGR